MGREIPRSADQQVESGVIIHGAQTSPERRPLHQLDACGRQLDRQGQAVQALPEGGDRGGVTVTGLEVWPREKGALNEECDRRTREIVSTRSSPAWPRTPFSGCVCRCGRPCTWLSAARTCRSNDSVRGRIRRGYASGPRTRTSTSASLSVPAQTSEREYRPQIAASSFTSAATASPRRGTGRDKRGAM